MKAIFKRDFYAFFTSAIGYVYLGAYILVLNLMFYFNNVLNSYTSLASQFNFMLLVMMFTTPILTMRIFSEEYKQKTDQFLCTAPVSTSAIVIGKFFSSLAVFGCLLTLTLAWPIIIAIYGELNTAELIGNYIGMACIGSAYIAMGIFISALTENQVIAAIGSLGLFVALYILELVATWFYSTGVLPTIVMQIFLFISIFGRYDEITGGLLSIESIVFYLSVCSFFLFLTIRAVEKKRM